MKTVTLLYHILMPPIFLFRFCSPHPPEPSSGPRTRVEDNRLLRVINSGVQNYQRENESGVFINRNEAADILKMGAVDFDNVNRSTTFLKQNAGSYKKRPLHTGSFINFRNSRPNFPHQEIVNNVNKDNEAFWFRRPYYADLYSSVDFDHRRNVDKRKFQKSGNQLSSLMEQNILTESNTSWNDNSSSHKDESLQSRKGDWSSHSSQVHRSHAKSRVRKRRGLDETLLAGVKPASSQRTPPEYMVHLFQLLSGTHYEALRSFIATGFVNINKNADSEGKMSRAHKLTFNVFLPHERETVQYAELKLYFYLKRTLSRAESHSEISGRRQGKKYIINIFETYQHSDKARHLIVNQTVVDPDNTWLSFNITSVVQNWSPSGLQVLEVYFDVCEGCQIADNKHNDSNEDHTDNDSSVLVLDLDNEGSKGPLLVIFAAKHETPKHVTHRKEKRDTTKRKEGANRNFQFKINDTDYKNYNNLSNLNYFQGLFEFISAVSDDSTKYLDADDADDADSLKNIVLRANTLYDQSKNTMKEKLILNVKNSTFLNSDANFQSANMDSTPHRQFKQYKNEVNTSSMKAHSFHKKKDGALKEQHSKTLKNIKRIDRNSMTRRQSAKARYKRHLEKVSKPNDATSGLRQKRSKKRNSCQRKEMFVDFETIKWDKLILMPIGYQAFECVGKCHTPISEYLTPTKHAIIQTLVHTNYPEQASRACCVPTKLDPISIAYWDEKGNIKVEYACEEMVVAECGCR